MSSGQMSCDLDLIFMVQWSKLNFCGFFSVFHILFAIGLLYLLCGMIDRCAGLVGRCHVILTSFSWSSGQS